MRLNKYFFKNVEEKNGENILFQKVSAFDVNFWNMF